jgi:TonB-dependent starch-binding outer membrane protein SusC
MRKRYNPLLKFIPVILILLFLQITARASGQEKLTLEFKNTELVKALVLIEEKSDYHFVYNNNLVTGSNKITASFKEASLQEVMGKLLKGTGLGFQLTETNLVILFKEKPAGNIETRISGKVTDENGKALSGASIQHWNIYEPKRRILHNGSGWRKHCDQLCWIYIAGNRSSRQNNL